MRAGVRLPARIRVLAFGVHLRFRCTLSVNLVRVRARVSASVTGISVGCGVGVMAVEHTRTDVRMYIAFMICKS